MKKMLTLLVCLCLLPLTACAQESAADTLILDEVTELIDRYHTRAMNETPMNDPANDLTEDGYQFVYEFGTVYADSAVMSQDTAVTAVVLTVPGEEGPRGIQVDDTINTVLGAFYTENADLAGSREFAVMYSLEMLPERFQWAEVQRDGQRVHTIQYAVHEQTVSGGEGYTDAGVIFTMQENFVSAIRVYCAKEHLSADALSAVVDNIRLHAAFTAYKHVPFSFDGAELDKFNPDDLIFSGMDFLSLTPEAAEKALGAPLADEWMEDGENGFIRTMTFSDGDVVFSYDVSKQNPSVYMMMLTDGGVEGPRCVRIGDSFAGVFNRFRNGEGDMEELTELLYGSLDGSEYGVAEYGQPYQLRYALTLEDGMKVVLHMTFNQHILAEILLYTE